MASSRGLSALLRFSRGIDALSIRIGSAIAWLIVAAILISAINATVRKLFSISSNAWLEVQWYLFGATFLLSAARVLAQDKHVRVDLIYASRRKRTQLWIDLLGHLFFLLPMCVLMLYYGVPFAIKSIASAEYSLNPGGLILWPAKALIPLGFLLLLAQAISEIIKRVARLVEPNLADATR